MAETLSRISPSSDVVLDINFSAITSENSAFLVMRSVRFGILSAISSNPKALQNWSQGARPKPLRAIYPSLVR